MQRVPYTYVVLRYRHDPLVGEFVNVGIILHAPKSNFLGIIVRHTLGRLPRIFPGMDGAWLKDSLRSVERAANRLARCEGGDLLSSLKDARSVAKTILPDDDSSLIWGPLGSGTSRDPAQTLESLFHRFVSLHDVEQRPHRDDAAVWKPVRDKLAERNLVGFLQSKTISSDVDYVEFPHAWKNGEWHCYQPLSFDLANDENIRDKARKWAGHMLALRNASEQFKPFFLVGSPSIPGLISSYRAAIQILRLTPEAEIFEEERIDELVSQIENEIRALDRIDG